jgi:hypothetical protein
MARPAASSLEELIRTPVERRSMAVESLDELAWRADLATKELTFVLITVMTFLLKLESKLDKKLF